MAQDGRGGAPSGFIGRSTMSDLHRSTTTQDERQGQGPGNGRPSNGQQGPVSGQIELEAEASLVVVRDLRKSGLEPRDIQARVLGSPERASCRVPSRGEGYVIPYFDISGAPLTFYRARVLNADYATNGVKYKQPSKTPNHIYFPRNFRATLKNYCQKHNHSRILIITEGEKKAACADKFGFPAVALSGVDSWRSRTIVLPEDTEFYSTTSEDANSNGGRQGKRGPIKARLPSSDSSVPELISLAKGFGDIIDTITQFNLFPIIIYDSDQLGTLKAEVQRAATMLAYELVFLGIHANRIKQAVLPSLASPQPLTDEGTQDLKSGLDDFIMERGPEALQEMIDKVLVDPKAFPRHPNPKGFISTQLQNRMSRKCMQQVASMILTELDAGGMRLIDKTTGFPYYYDSDTAVLILAKLQDNKTAPFHEQKFGQLLYQKYGISANDSRVITWLASQFTGEDPIHDVSPRRVLTLITEKEDALNPFGVAYQVSDSQYLAISADPKNPIEVLTNGSKGILFEQDQVEPLDIEQVLDHFDHQLSEAKEKGQLHSWWSDVLAESSIGIGTVENDEPNDEGLIEVKGTQAVTEQGREMRAYAALLCYVSPFLLRWRGLQLPIELTVGPPGSGKSSLYELRLQVLTGRPKLRNIPGDIKDWQASLAHSGGLHVTDNVHFMNKDLKQRVSDELCRITTEPSPHIEMRKYFTNTDVLRFPVAATFAFTAIQAPFHNEDLIQRSVTFRTTFIPDREPEGNWAKDRLEVRGGREAWIAHHLVFLHLFLQQEWNAGFRTQHRLAHLEQVLTMASKVVDLDPPSPELFADQITPATESAEPEASTPVSVDTSTEQVHQVQQGPKPLALGQTLLRNQAVQITSSDWVIQGIQDFVKQRYPEVVNGSATKESERFTAGDISDWCNSQEEHQDNEILGNSRKLGRYMVERLSTLHQVLNVRSAGSYANKQVYRVFPRNL